MFVIKKTEVPLINARTEKDRVNLEELYFREKIYSAKISDLYLLDIQTASNIWTIDFVM